MYVLKSTGSLVVGTYIATLLIKSAYIIFKANKRTIREPNLYIGQETLRTISEIKYLGVIISDQLTLKLDADRMLNSFLGQFNSFYFKFHFVSSEVLYFLFRTYCTSFYGINTWTEELISNNKIRKISVGFHKAVKRTANMLPWDSNHEACQKVDINIFKHLLIKRILGHFLTLLKSENVIISGLHYYFRYCSQIYRVLSHEFTCNYNVDNFLNNDKDALMSRIDFVERNEPRSHYNFIINQA